MVSKIKGFRLLDGLLMVKLIQNILVTSRLSYIKSLSIMFFFRYLFLATLQLALMSCTNNPEVRDDDTKATEALVGVWRGGGTYKDEEDTGWAESWKMVRESDGTYKVDYLVVNDGEKKFEQSSGAGTWTYEDGVYYEVNSNGEKTTYDVFSVKVDWFEYNIAQRQGSINIEERKTVDKFQLQGPPEGYSEVSYEPPTLQDQIQIQIQIQDQDQDQDQDLHLAQEIPVDAEK